MNEDIKRACEVLENGGIILYPTDTIWGIGCDATNSTAVEKIYALKQRSDHKAMLVLIDSDAKIERYVQEVPEIAWSLVDVAIHPLTIIYPGAKNLAENLIGSDGSIGIRITQEKFSQTLCRQFKKPIVSTSANISGQPAATTFNSISDEIKNGVDYIVSYRQNDEMLTNPSNIIMLGLGGEVKIIR